MGYVENMIAPVELSSILEFVEDLARSAGDLLRESYYRRPRRIHHKGAVNLVTQADLEAEELIVSRLKARFSDYGLLAEEGGEAPASSGGRMWLVDPLDGTNNFAHGLPVFAVSIALRDASGPILGVVYDPLRDECFSAVRGHRATLNGQTIRVSDQIDIEKSLLSTGFPYDHLDAQDNNSAAVAAFLRRAQDIRRAGAAALDLAYVAAGRLDGHWEMGLDAWDVGAGILLVREAGGTVTGYTGDAPEQAVLSGKQVVASNGHIHAAMLDTLREVYDFSGDGSFTLKNPPPAPSRRGLPPTPEKQG